MAKWSTEPKLPAGQAKRSNKKEKFGFLNEMKQGCWLTGTWSVTDNAPSLISARQRSDNSQRNKARMFCKGVFKSAVSGDFGRQVLDAPSAAALAQDVAVQWVTASALPLGGQQEPAFLVDTHSSQFNATPYSACGIKLVLASFSPHRRNNSHGSCDPERLSWPSPPDPAPAWWARHTLNSEVHTSCRGGGRCCRRWRSVCVKVWKCGRTDGSLLCSGSERWRPRWRGHHPNSSYRPRTWSSEGGRPSPLLAGSGPGWVWSTLNSAPMYSETNGGI